MCNDRIWILLTRKLSGEATPTELRELDALLENDPQQLHTVQTISSVWNNSNQPAGDFLEATYLAHLERTRQKGIEISSDESLETEVFPEQPTNRRFFRSKWFSAWAVLIVVALAGVLFINSKNSIAANKEDVGTREVVTRNGNRTKLKLPDGTNVWLNSGTKLTYGKNFDKEQRDVYLSGEAYFDVVHNASKPFIIHTSSIAVKVLGTQFNVKAYDNDITTETSLINGKVEISLNETPGKKYFLKPYEKLVLRNTALNLQSETAISPDKTAQKLSVAKLPEAAIKPISYLSEYNTDIESSWTRNILSFEDELFSEVAKKLERWYDVRIVFDNKRLKLKYISGAFEHESLEQALEALKYTTGFKYRKVGNEINIY